jgi:CheY-like chemotaxis protein
MIAEVHNLSTNNGNLLVGTVVDILLVEDNEDHIELTMEALKAANVVNNLIVIRNGREALKYVDRVSSYGDEQKYPLPGLILLDIKLPDMTGIDLLRHMKGVDGLKMTPVVMLTSSIRMENVDECYRLGANSYIEKPISFGDFIETVKKIPLYWALINKLPGDLVV